MKPKPKKTITPLGTTTFHESESEGVDSAGNPVINYMGRRDFIQNFGTERKLTGKQFSSRVNDAISFISEEMRRARKNKALVLITFKASWSEPKLP